MQVPVGGVPFPSWLLLAPPASTSPWRMESVEAVDKHPILAQTQTVSVQCPFLYGVVFPSVVLDFWFPASCPGHESRSSLPVPGNSESIGTIQVTTSNRHDSRRLW